MQFKRSKQREARDAKKQRDRERHAARRAQRSAEHAYVLPHQDIRADIRHSLDCAAPVDNEPARSQRVPVPDLPPSDFESLASDIDRALASDSSATDDEEAEPATRSLTNTQIEEQRQFQRYCLHSSQVRDRWQSYILPTPSQLTNGKLFDFAEPYDVTILYEAIQADLLGWRLFQDIENDNHQASCWTRFVIWAQDNGATRDFLLRLTERCYAIINTLEILAQGVFRHIDAEIPEDEDLPAIVDSLRDLAGKLTRLLCSIGELRLNIPGDYVARWMRSNCLYWQNWYI
ncbi:hypothetical protein BKA62DRAFT_775630 [Auriculariales sp. MPI-PUGE-AT-0066]|nr:hypothetical protein BKA62DRAFT_775630 [Auriculariales sp. MPI-PUGE-AT-0066]